MTYNEIQEALIKFRIAGAELEDAFIESEGEVTEATEDKEQIREAIKELLCTDGVDSLGRWLKSLNDDKETFKAEKEMADKRIKNIDKRIDFVKEAIFDIMRETETDKVTGKFYTFKPYVSEKTIVNKELLLMNYEQRVKEALQAAQIPSYIKTTLSASVKAVEEFGEVCEEDAELFSVERHNTCKFTKPSTK